jgi:hypothetical protein
MNTNNSVRKPKTITPEMARAWLAQNTKNRPLNVDRWMRYALDMMDGRWKYNGDAIRLDSTGRLLDGQHRLHACVESGCSFVADVITGLDPDVFDTIDIGDARKAADIVSVAGFANASHACALAYLLLLDRKNGVHKPGKPRPTKTQVIQLAKSDALITEAARRASQWGRSIVSPRVLSFCFYKFCAINRDMAEAFFEAFTTGTNLDKTNPVYLLRERVLVNSQQRRKMPYVDVIALFYRAWNAGIEGRPLQGLRVRPSEEFPKLLSGKLRRAGL